MRFESCEKLLGSRFLSGGIEIEVEASKSHTCFIFQAGLLKTRWRIGEIDMKYVPCGGPI
jgi:hypothetical protein